MTAAQPTPATPAASQLRERVEAALRRFLSEAAAPVAAMGPELAEFTAAAVAFARDGGKRLRPAFCYWGHRAVGADDGEPVIRAAGALELVQVAALVHDDVIDRSDTRRGAPSVHRQFAALHAAHGWRGDGDRFGEAAAVLLGDLALIWADRMLATSGFPAELLSAAGAVWDEMRVEVMAGQYLDVVEQARGGGSVERALQVARFKSARYTVERPVHLGAVLGAADDRQVAALRAYGGPVGEAFQLRDDLLGVFGDPGVTGKPAGDDLREGKRTVLVALTLAAADGSQRALVEQRLGDPDLDDAGVAALREVIDATGAARHVEQLIDERTASALAALDGAWLDPVAVAALRELAVAATQRAR